jgi:SAM-dependent methyltransferase
MKRARCPNGTRRNTHTLQCESYKKYEKYDNNEKKNKDKVSRCKKGTRMNKKTKKCTSIATKKMKLNCNKPFRAIMDSAKTKTRIEMLCKKIFKGKDARPLITVIMSGLDANTTIHRVSELAFPLVAQNQKQREEDDKSFIGKKLADYLKYKLRVPFNSMIDVGGGNGNLLHYFATHYHIPKQQLVCVESVNEWAEPYQYTHNDTITYELWDSASPWLTAGNGTAGNGTMDVATCMVSLHHMPDPILNLAVQQTHDALKSGGILCIKEHNCVNADDAMVIDWEHHLFHISDMGRSLSEDEVNAYLCGYIDNFKPATEFNKLMSSHGFVKIEMLNRFFERAPDPNPSNLYWGVYRKR